MTQSRKARTRSLIQIGGLVEKAGLLPYFHITLGQDLQKDEAIKDDVMTLLGALITLKLSDGSVASVNMLNSGV